MSKMKIRNKSKQQENQNKEPKRKPKYGMMSCVGWMTKKLWEWNKSIAISAVGVIPLAIALYSLGLYIPSVVIGQLQTNNNFLHIALIITALLSAQLFFMLIKNYIDIKRGNSESIIYIRMSRVFQEKVRDLDYYMMLEKENQEKSNRGFSACYGSGNRFPVNIANMLVDILCFFIFGSVISSLSPIIIVLLIAGTLINFFMQKFKSRMDYQHVKARDLNIKKINYITYNVSRNLKYGKDIRLFGLAGFLSAVTFGLIDDHLVYFNKMQRTQTAVTLTSGFVAFLRDGLAYVFLIYKAVAGEINAAQFVLYFSAISQLSNFISGVIGVWANVREGAIQVSDYREYFELNGKLNRGKGIEKPCCRPLSIEFKNVSYKYPEGEKKILDNVSFKIEAGEKIALVGLNGAGKTTLTMLCCGLLVPDEGEVLIDGHSVFEYNRDDLYSLFSIVPQLYNLLPMSIAENIALCCTEQINLEKLEKCLSVSGLGEKTATLEKGAFTQLNKQVDVTAVELSGGEVQKLLLARALYRNAPVLILDEPTAALDPIAEDSMYRKYCDISSNTTSIFISHRLASTRFCDRIYLLDGANFAECGTHEELMEKKAKYRELFDIQSAYYK